VAGLQARRIQSVTPIYPQAAKDEGIEGKVTLNLLIGPDGKVVKALIISGPTVLGESVLDAVKQWEYKPASSFTFAPAEIIFSREGVRI
jgi:TonB family protein